MIQTYSVEYIDDLEQQIAKLKEGACRYNCRTAKENWKQGYIECQHNRARGKADLDAQEAYNEWKRK